MFSVKYLHQNLDSIKPILNGISFGFFDKPLFFDIKADTITSTLNTALIVSKHESNESIFEIGPINKNHVDIFYRVPKIFSFSSLNFPTSLINVDDKLLAIMFSIMAISDTAFKFEYEIYEGQISKEGTAK